MTAVPNDVFHILENIEAQFLRNKPDPGPRPPPMPPQIVPERGHCPTGRTHRAANRADQGGLACAVRAKQREYLPPANGQIDIVERPQAAGICL